MQPSNLHLAYIVTVLWPLVAAPRRGSSRLLQLRALIQPPRSLPAAAATDRYTHCIAGYSACMKVSQTSGAVRTQHQSALRPRRCSLYIHREGRGLPARFLFFFFLLVSVPHQHLSGLQPSQDHIAVRSPHRVKAQTGRQALPRTTVHARQKICSVLSISSLFERDHPGCASWYNTCGASP
jgi:hypothetical protein